MGKLIYSAIASIDGYVADQHGNFDWAEPDEEVHAFINDLQRRAGIHLYGRRMYELMTYWETADTLPDEPPPIYEFAKIWQGAEKIVYSRTLASVSTARTRIERAFDPATVRQIKAATPLELIVGGPELAAQAIHSGLVDEYRLFVAPVIVGGGKQFLPRDVRMRLRVLDERRFHSGFVYLRYANEQ